MHKVGDVISSNCETCGPARFHDVLYVDDGRVPDPDKLNIKTRSVFLRCSGCRSTSILKYEVDIHLEGKKRKVGNTYANYRSYPPFVKRKMPEYMLSAPDNIKNLAADVYFSFNSKAYRLCVIGARSIFEDILNQKIGDVGGFKEKTNALASRNIITESQRNLMMSAIDNGSAAVHRNHEPSEEDASKVLDVMETMTNLMYGIESIADHLRNKTPIRNRGGV